MATSLVVDGPEDATLTVALTHGAGGGMDTPFMEYFTAGLVRSGHRVVRFEFPYMAARRSGGSRRPPDRTEVLTRTWQQVIASLGADRLVIGGKSLGGRMASMVADEAGVAGLVCLGYPFHPPGKPERTRIAHLENLTTPTLVLQGSRDPFGTVEDVAGYALSPVIRLHWLADGDHGFRPRVASGRTERENLDEAHAHLTVWLANLPGRGS
ncbi:MAG: alpha/beta family hydrolase [Rhodospirillales bacterium]